MDPRLVAEGSIHVRDEVAINRIEARIHSPKLKLVSNLDLVLPQIIGSQVARLDL